MTRVLMFQGTGSSVGKSTLLSGVARALTRRGYRVRPFKPQNMSNNAAVTADGGEIGRAQALQAFACRVPPSVEMNPILLKPLGKGGSQIVVRGHHGPVLSARAYQEQKQQFFPYVKDAFKRLCRGADIVLVEGAGSASEINLRRHDIANMGFARAENVPVILIGDIDRGGVIASLVGTKVVLDPQDAACIKAFIVNKMRGDISLFTEAMEFISRKTGWCPIGINPYFESLRKLPQEDSADMGHYFKSFLPNARSEASSAQTTLKIVVPVYPMIANYDDLDPLMLDEGIELLPLYPGEQLPEADIIILLGSKDTISDLNFMRRQGWDKYVQHHAHQGKGVIGICGGYQMLGKSISDPYQQEGREGRCRGLGLIDMQTILAQNKTLQHVKGYLSFAPLIVFSAYEMHLGQCYHQRKMGAFATISRRGEGVCDGKIMGTYLHGIFKSLQAREAIFTHLKPACAPIFHDRGYCEERHYERSVDNVLNQWAAHCEAHIDIDKMLTLAGQHATVSSF